MQKGIAAYLPGRRYPVLICHSQPAGCEECMALIAGFLARESGWDLAAALDRSAESYGAELHPSRCTLDQAREIRRLVVKACYAVNRDREVNWIEAALDDDWEESFLPQPIVADFDFASEAVAA